jgi:hypothetical protein
MTERHNVESKFKCVPASNVSAENALGCPPCLIDVIGDFGQHLGHVVRTTEIV